MSAELEPIRMHVDAAPEEGRAIEVADGVLWFRLPLPMALDHVNVFALDEGDGWAIVDTGIASGRSRAIWEAMLAGPLAGRPVRRLIVTHHHPDHAGLAGWFQSRGARLEMSRTAYLMARMLTLDVQEAWPEEARAFYRRAGMAEDVLRRRSAERPFNFADTVSPLHLGFERLREGQVIALGGRQWDVRMGAGHAPEHVTLWSRDDGLVLGGDQFLATISPNIGVYPTEPDADPLADWLAACDRFRGVATEDRLVLPGHKLPFTGLPARLVQMIDNHLRALDRLQAHLARPGPAGGAFEAIFGRAIGPAEYGLALVEAYAHCNHLWRTGRARRELVDGIHIFAAA